MFELVGRYMRGYYLTSGIGLFLKFVEALFDLAVPLIVASIIDKGIGGGDSSYVFAMSGVLVALSLVGFASSVTCQYFAARSALGFGTNLRKRLFAHINSLSCSDLDSLGIPSLVTRITADATNAQVSVNMFVRLASRAPLMLIGSIGAAVMINAHLSLIFVVAAVLVAVALYLVTAKTYPHYKRVNRRLDEVSLLTRQNLSGVRVVRAFSRQAEEIESFSSAAKKLAKTNKTASLISALMTPLSFGIVNLAVIAILYFGSVTVYSGSLTQGEVIALINYMTHIFYSLTILATIIAIFAKGSASAKRINAVLKTTPTISYGQIDLQTAMQHVQNSETAVEFDGVGLEYGTNTSPSLENVSFTLKKGQVLGIIGRTASGKSSIVNLIERFYEPQTGEIKLFGVRSSDYSSKALRGLIAWVPQTAVLFSGTIRENMLMSNPLATDEQIWSALKTAQAEPFVKKLPDGLDTKVIKGGKNFSGGQRQRLTIARALVKDSPLLILDDSASALDFATDAKLRRAIKKWQGDRAVIIISQRAPSIMHANQILVLENGKPAGLAPHDKLMQTCEIYNEIYNSQVAAN